jgi:MarR family transcriptional regulator for hemolysin
MITAASIEERFASALHAAARAWRQALDRRLRHLGISQAGWLAVTVTAKSKHPLSQTELADKLGVEGATMVAMIDRLVKSQLVTREPSKTDRRVKYIALTEAGNRLYTNVRVEAEAFRREILASIDASRLVAATELLEELLKVVEAQR